MDNNRTYLIKFLGIKWHNVCKVLYIMSGTQGGLREYYTLLFWNSWYIMYKGNRDRSQVWVERSRLDHKMSPILYHWGISLKDLKCVFMCVCIFYKISFSSFKNTFVMSVWRTDYKRDLNQGDWLWLLQ